MIGPPAIGALWRVRNPYLPFGHANSPVERHGFLPRP